MSRDLIGPAPPADAHLAARAQAVLATLDPEQRTAVQTAGPVIVSGGPATGKTRVLAHRIGYLCASGRSAPRRILALCRTPREAQLLRARAERLLAFPLHGVWIDTCPEVCLRILRAHAAALGRKPSFVILGESEARVLVRRAAQDLEGAEPYSPARLLELISEAKVRRIVPPGVVGEIYRRYEAALAEANAFDADDLMRHVLGLLEEDPALGAKYRRRFTHILIDDLEDTTPAERELVANLGGERGDVIAVFDEDQALGVDAGDAAADFRARFPGAPTLALTTTYRSTKRIAHIAARVIARNPRPGRPALAPVRRRGARVVAAAMADESEEAQLVAAWIRRLAGAHGVPPARCAILYRHTVQARAFEEALVRAGMPYRVASGPRFYERREIKDVLAYLRLALGGGETAALARIANVPRRGIGPASVATIARLCKTARITMAEAALRAASLPRVTAQRAGALADLGRLLTDLGEGAQRLGAAELMDYVVERSGYGRLLTELSRAEEESRREGLDELRGIARALAGPALDAVPRLLERVALVSGEGGVELPRGDEPGVQLLTFAEAKGRDFEVVFLTGWEEGILPGWRALAAGDAAVAAERRLAYVALTRARNRLVITRALARTIFGRTRPGEPSRFLAEAGRRVRHFRLGNARPGRTPQTPPEEPPALVKVIPGQRVLHPRYGLGLVVRLEPGPRTMVSVRFDDGDEKRLALDYARLLPA
jgi:DNA helicase-2/ATP-dependent DNA helicase PcrA